MNGSQRLIFSGHEGSKKTKTLDFEKNNLPKTKRISLLWLIHQTAKNQSHVNLV
jgi:hypothetical protein